MRKLPCIVLFCALLIAPAVSAQTLNSLTIQAPNELLSESQANCTVRAGFTNGAAFDVTLCASMNVWPPELATLTPLGHLTVAHTMVDTSCTLHAVFTYGDVTLEATHAVQIAAVPCLEPVYVDVQTVGSTGAEEIRRIRIGPDGERYVCGFFSGTVDFDPSVDGVDLRSSHGNTDGFVSKFSASGTYQWTRTWGGSGPDVCTDVATAAAEGLYVLGTFTYCFDMNPDGGAPACVDPNGPGSRTDVFVVKVDNDGAYLWGNRLGGIYDDVASQIVATRSGGCAVAGEFQGLVDFNPGPAQDLHRSYSDTYSDFFVWRLDSDGAYRWAFTKGGNQDDAALAITEAPDESLYVAGLFYSGVILLDPGPPQVVITRVGASDAFALHLTANGTFIKAISWGSPSTDAAVDIALAPNGDVVLGGYFWETIDFDPDPSPPAVAYRTAVGQQDAFILRLTPGLQFIWVSTIGGTQSDGIESVAVGADNRVYGAGYFLSSMNFTGAEGPVTLTAHGAEDVFVLKYAPLGTLNWGIDIGGTQSERAQALAVLGTDKILCGGWYRGTCDFNPDPNVQELRTAVGDSDAYIVELRCGPPDNVPCTGDTNCDGDIDFADIDPFVLALSGESAYLAAYPDCRWLNGDANGDQTVDFADIDEFVELLFTVCP